MANTTNLNLSKLSGTEKLKTFPTPYSDNMDAIDGAFGAGFGVGNNSSVDDELNGLGKGMAIIANGNTHAAITSGQYVFVRQHGSLSEGLYRATANISANGTLSGSNLTAVSSGGLNELNSKIGDLLAIESHTSATFDVSNGEAFTVDVDMSKTGYTFLGIVGITGSKDRGLYITEFFRRTTTSARIYGVAGESHTGSSFTVYGLYKKD